ncbi:helix-turn-helix domain-containing protein [Verrucosispora sp. ts21]|uniref:helix-turn-helix domain-containing protein n=1 Tax=Verrucosispora sp. ts21 TaxID=2069341 RepID=UPI0011AF5D95|nr:helix-turn-helix domain-containing protein [Verrucosispora sp. ts21]
MTAFDAELWRQSLSAEFGGLAADSAGEPTGTICGTALGPLTAYDISAGPQVLRRTPQAVRREPFDRLALLIQLAGAATVGQDGRLVPVEPGQMALYDAGRPYDLLLAGQWTGVVLTFARDALYLPDSVVRQARQQVQSLLAGPGAVLASFVASVTGQRASIGASATRLGEAGLHLVAGALGMSQPLESPPLDGEAVAESQRIRVLEYVGRHLTDSTLSHDRVAAAHRMAPRTLHRLFEHKPYTVTEYIRLRRLESARRDLADPLLSHLSIARVAARWCFGSQAHFTRAFQARYGVLPSGVRPLGQVRRPALVGGDSRVRQQREGIDETVG